MIEPGPPPHAGWAALAAAVAVSVAGLSAAQAGELKLDGILMGRGIVTEGQRSWLEGGFGRLTEGGDAPGDSVGTVRGQAHLGLDWRPSTRVLVHAHGVARSQPDRAGGRALGLAEAFVQFRPELSASASLRLRAGLFFPGISRENTGRLWSSPYTLTLSALNTWTAEELRLAGLEALLAVKTARGDEVQLAGAAFGGNDTAGALIAWRGWSLGDRLSAAGEVLPLPPLRSFAPGGGFADQRREGTRPVDELDDRLGWEARARWERPDVITLQGSYLDNRGDRGLHRGQYSWATRFGAAGADLHLGRSLVLVGEGAIGDAGMGPLTEAHVDVRFKVGYLLLSWGREKLRVSARYDRFENVDRDHTAEPDQETGHAWTLAAFWQPGPHWRLGAEALSLRAARPAAADAGANPDTDARRVQLELRFVF